MEFETFPMEDFEEEMTEEQEKERKKQMPAAILPLPRERKVDEQGKAVARGTRKRSVASVILKPGNGNVTVNSLPLVDYFPQARNRDPIFDPFLVTETLGQFDLDCKVQGGGKSYSKIIHLFFVQERPGNPKPFVWESVEHFKISIQLGVQF